MPLTRHNLKGPSPMILIPVVLVAGFLGFTVGNIVMPPPVQYYPVVADPAQCETHGRHHKCDTRE